MNDFSKADTPEKLLQLQRESKLSPEQFADSFREYQWESLLKQMRPSSRTITLENAKTRKQHAAVYHRYRLVWWWRLKGENEWNSLFPVDTVKIAGQEHRISRKFSILFRYRYECSAFEYERLARKNAKGPEPQFEFGKPWCALTRKQMDELARRWPMPCRNSIPWRTARNPLPHETILHCYAFNLRESDAALLEAFKEIIQFERQRRGILCTSRKGHRTKAYPWRQIELMDLKQLGQYRTKTGETTLSDTDRSRLSKAKRGPKRL